jgi:pimeloyl-ACP methyl ester carboxylesterase
VDDLAACLRWPRSIVETGRGRVEYAERGTGTPLLSVHGSPGGCDQGLLIADLFRANGFRVIAPSRPGYLGTPLTSGRTSEEQADLFAALLDELGVERVVVLGLSGGGPSTYLFAARHPERVSRLVEVASISMSFIETPQARNQDRVAMSRLGNRLLLWVVDHPALLARLNPEFGPGRELDANSHAMMRGMVATFRGRQVGCDNDVAEFERLAPLPLAAISSPTLLVHGTADVVAVPKHTELAAVEIPGAEVRWIDGGTHAGVVTDEATYRQTLDWLVQNSD